MEKAIELVEKLTDTYDHLTEAERCFLPGVMPQTRRVDFEKIREARETFRGLLRDALVPPVTDKVVWINNGGLVGGVHVKRMDIAELRWDLLSRAIELDGLDSPLAANAARALADVIDREKAFKDAGAKRDARNRAR